MKEKIAKSLEKVGFEKEDVLNLLEKPKDNSLGDYALPCFVLAKKEKKNPVVIAKEVASKIKIQGISKVEANGPYVNFFIDQKDFANRLIEEIRKKGEMYGNDKLKKKIVIEICSPNSNKPLHLGHARNIILGQSIAKINDFMGNKVKRVIVNNDRGVHICKAMVAYDKFGKGETPEKIPKKSDHFVGDYYVKFTKEAKKNDKIEDEALDCLNKWEAGDSKTIKLWKKMNKWAFDGFKETYKYFDLKFDEIYYESQIYKFGKEIILDALKKKKISKKEDGAVFMDLNDKGLGEKILLRKDGTSIYIVQDIYLAKKRFDDLKFDKMLYVVGNEQDYHFKVLFEILKRFGYSWADKLEHLSYGMVNLESGRMKSREGTVVDIDDLIKDLKKLAVEEVEKRYPKLHADEVSNRAFAIAMAALRYYFLKIDKSKDTVFKPKDSLSFEGDTGPYLLYNYARALKLLEKSKYKPKKKFEIKLVSESERELINKIGNFPEVVKKSYETLSPNLIANYSFELSQIFSSFYHNSRVIGSKEEDYRLALVEVFAQTLKNALSLLDIPVIPEM